MASSAFDKVKKKYGWSRGRYEKLIGRIISENQKKISQVVLSSSKSRFDKQLEKIERHRKIVLPDIHEMIQRSPTIIKAASQGELISKTLRDKLKANIKETLLESNITTTRGTIRKDIAMRAKRKMTGTYSGYIRKDATHALPHNLYNIAVTETNAVISQVRHDYVRQVQIKTGREIRKRWVHNSAKHGGDRKGHVILAQQKPIPLNEKFKMPVFVKVNGSWVDTGNYYLIDRPHDKILPANEVITCACELEYVFI